MIALPLLEKCEKTRNAKHHGTHCDISTMNNTFAFCDAQKKATSTTKSTCLTKLVVSTTKEVIPTAGAYNYSLLGRTSIRRSESLDATATVKGLWKIESTSDRSRNPSSK